jgi:hypothetical protein
LTVDANLAVAGVGTLQEILDRASAQMAFTMVLLAIAAGVALMLGRSASTASASIVSLRTGRSVRLGLAELRSVAG